MTVRADAVRALGSSGVSVTALGLGCAPLGNLFTAVTDADARSTVEAAWEAGVRLFDTAPLYGSGLSESRLGAALEGRTGALVTSKVGRVLDPSLTPDPIFVGAPPLGPRFDFSEPGVRASLASSLERLGVERLEVCWVHDPDDHEPEATSQALPSLHRLRDEGLVGAVGVGMNEPAMPTRMVRAGSVDAVLIAGCWSLLDRSADDELLGECLDRGVGVVVGGVFGSGLLADPWNDAAHYRYEAAPGPIVTRARLLDQLCRDHDVSLTAAAIQFPFRHPAVSAVVVGARSAAEFVANVDALHAEIPDELWSAVDALPPLDDPA